MTTKKRTERKKRVVKLAKVLAQLYPEPKIALEFTTPWELLVAVILSAQCTDARVNMVTHGLFKTYRSLEAYANATQTEMEQAVFPCGFYRNKAKHIRGAARMIIEEYGGSVPSSMEELLRLPGVARKTANVVLSTAFGIHEGIAVDTHVRRFAIRFDLTDFTDPVRIEKDLQDVVPRSEWWAFNHRLVQYGRDVCPARKHVCEHHPLTVMFPAAAHVWPKAR